MSMDELVVYLRLAPEFGGTRFGPFEQLEVRLGSDPDRCHIVLPESLGVISEHAKVIRQGPQNFILAPAERTATVFLWKQGARRPSQLNTPTAVRPGDAFSLVTSDGPRFILELDELPEELKAQRDEAGKRSGTGRNRLSAKSMGTEVKRQAWTSLLVTGPAQIGQRIMVFVKSGAIYQPRNIIMGLTIAAGYIFGGAMLCRGRSSSKQLVSTQKQYQNCKDDLSMADGMGGDSTGFNFSELAGKVTGSRRLATGLDQDQNLRSAVKKKSRTIFASARDYEWLIENSDRQAGVFGKWREMVAESDALDDDTKVLVTWLAARPGRLRGEFESFQDSESTDVCGRGPIRMTYRQAVHFGLEVQADAYYRGMASNLDDAETRDAMLLETINAAAQPAPEGEIESDLTGVRAGSYCVFYEGEDDRTRFREVVRALDKQLGSESGNAPTIGSPSASISRLAKYWTADLTLVDYQAREQGVAFTDETVPSAVLENFESRGAWAMARTAETIAQSIVVPCLAVLNGDREKVKAVLGERLPSPVDCLVLSWKLQNEE